MIRRSKDQSDREACRLPVVSILAAILIVASFLMLQGADGQENADLSIGYYQNSPFIYRTHSGEVRGIAADTILPYLQSEGHSYDIVEIDGTNCSHSLRDDSVDLIIGCNIVVDLEDNVTFSSESLYSNWGVIYSNDDTEISTIFDLEDIWMGVVKDDIYFKGEDGLKSLVESFNIKANFVEFDNFNEVLESMEKGKVDAGLLNNALANFVQDEYEIKRTSIVFSPVDVGFAVDSNNSEMVSLLEGIDIYLRNLKDDPDSEYYGTLDEYLPDINDRPSDRFVPKWLIQAIVILGFSVLFLVAISLFLRRQVMRKTKDLELTNTELSNDIKRRRKIEKQLTQERNRSLFYLDLLIHDIGNIHQGLFSHIQLYDLVKNDRARADRSVGQMKGLLERSEVLVKNINKFTQAVSQEKNLEPKDLGPILRNSLASMMLANPAKDIRTSVDIPKKGMIVDCEPLIEEIFNNIFENAAKFQEGDRGIIELRAIESPDGRNFIITISDHGSGIPDKMKKQIFSRLERSTERKYRGMGLAIAKVLASRYGGRIEVDDRIKGDHTKGASFRVTLPRSIRSTPKN